jgi:hypothetical protein
MKGRMNQREKKRETPGGKIGYLKHLRKILHNVQALQIHSADVNLLPKYFMK